MPIQFLLCHGRGEPLNLLQMLKRSLNKPLDTTYLKPRYSAYFIVTSCLTKR